MLVRELPNGLDKVLNVFWKPVTEIQEMVMVMVTSSDPDDGRDFRILLGRFESSPPIVRSNSWSDLLATWCSLRSVCREGCTHCNAGISKGNPRLASLRKTIASRMRNLEKLLPESHKDLARWPHISG